MADQKIERCAGGWFVTGSEWSGPWASKDAADLARDGEYTLAHQEERKAMEMPNVRR